MKRFWVAALVLSVAGAAAGSPPPRDYPFRVSAVRLVGYALPDSGRGAHGGADLGADRPEGTGYAVLLDRNGAVEALKFSYYDTGCFYHAKDLYYQVGGYYPARWVKENEIALVTNISGPGTVHECRFKVKQMAVPNTADYLRVTTLGPEQMARIYAGTSVTDPPRRPAPIKVRTVQGIQGRPPGYDASSALGPGTGPVH
jgi:hypothetical protein